MSLLGKYENELIGCLEDINVSEILFSPIVLRSSTNGIEGLADSISKIGLLQPILVRVIESGRFEIVAGNRRFNACRQLGWRKITCHVVELDDRSAFEVCIIENIQRNTLNPVEEGLAFARYVNEFGWGGISQLAQKISKSPNYVCRRIKLLELPKVLLDLVSESEIHIATAEELLSVKDKNRLSQLAVLIHQKNMSSREARRLVKKAKDETYEDSLIHYDTIFDEVKISRSFDKSIIALRIALNKLGIILVNLERNWIFYEVLRQHMNMLHTQIDLLIREKKRCGNRYLYST